MPFYRLYYHAVWATKGRAQVITETMAPAIEQAIRETCAELDVVVFAVGVMPDHVHVFAQIPPSEAVAKVVGRWKGASSFAANEHRPFDTIKLAWQAGYGLHTVGQRGFEQAKSYVENQRQRHANQDVYALLESSEDELARRPKSATNRSTSVVSAGESPTRPG